jgi:hypothetical protein
MAALPLSLEKAREALAAVQQHGSIQAAAVAMGLSRSTLDSRIVRARGMGLPAYVTQADEDGPSASTLFDDRWDVFTRWIGRTRTMKPAPKAKDGSRQEILHLTDMHIPYLHEEAFQTALDANPIADAVVVGGDGLNAGAVSRFIEADIVHPKDEFAQLTVVLQGLAERYPKVFINKGNHPERFKKYFGNRLPPYVMFLVQTDPIQFVVDGLVREHGVRNIHVAQPMIDDLGSSDWGTLIGDCMFTHGETHGKLVTRPAENVARWMRKWERHLAVKPRVIVQEHNHRGAMYYDEELQALLIQAPCLSQNVSYQVRADIKYGPNQLGWTRIVQEHGRTLVNESRFYLVDERGAALVA